MSDGKQAYEPETPTNPWSIPGVLGVVTKFGIVGVMAVAFLAQIFYIGPKQHTGFHDEIKAERAANREDLEKSRQHGKDVAKELADAIREQTSMIDWHQTMIQSNQERQLNMQKEMYLKKDAK